MDLVGSARQWPDCVQGCVHTLRLGQIPDAKIHLKSRRIRNYIGSRAPLDDVRTQRRAFLRILQRHEFPDQVRGANDRVPALLWLHALVRRLAQYLDDVVSDALARNLQIAVHEGWFQDQYRESAASQLLDHWSRRIRTHLFIRRQQDVNGVCGAAPRACSASSAHFACTMPPFIS